MKKSMFVNFSLFLLLLYFVPTGSNALTFDTLPIKQTSKQWAVQVGKAIGGKDNVKPVKGEFQTYSLNVDNIGNDVNSVEINIYRNEPNSKTKFSLFGCPDEKECNKDHYEQSLSLADYLNNDNPYVFQNFLIREKATKLEVDIVWTQKENPGRPLKETFTFTTNN